MHFYHHNMLVGVCRSTEKKNFEWFFIFCWKYEVNQTSRWGQKTPKIMVFGHFWYLIIVLGPLKLFILDLLMKTHLLVPNLWLYDLAFKIYLFMVQKRLKFGDFCQKIRHGSHCKALFTPKTLSKPLCFAAILFYTFSASFCYLIHACGCLRSPEIPKISWRNVKNRILSQNWLKRGWFRP
jgi:hypothetical protein